MISAVTTWANQGDVKQTIKNVLNFWVLIAGGIVISSELNKKVMRLLSNLNNRNSPNFNQSLSGIERKKGDWDVSNITLRISKVAVIGAFCSTQQIQQVIRWIALKILSPKSWETICGPNINFEGNWKHPRHVVSIISFALGLPAVIYTVWLTYHDDPRLKGKKEGSFLCDKCVIRATAVVTFFSRPAQHLTNLFLRKVLR